MAWETRPGGPRTGYYYRSVRTNEGVKKIYFGRGAAGQLAAAAVERRHRVRHQAKATIQAEQTATTEADQLAEELQDWVRVLSTAWLTLSGLHYHRAHGGRDNVAKTQKSTPRVGSLEWERICTTTQPT